MNNDPKKNTPNPYDVLDVSPAASNAEITKAFTVAMKQKKYPLDVIAKARKTLMNPQERLIADYLRPILPTVKRFKREDFTDLEKPELSLDLLPEFDAIDKEIAACKIVSELDRQLGVAIFSVNLVQENQDYAK